MPEHTENARPARTGTSSRRALLVVLAAAVGAAAFGVTAWLMGLRDDDASTLGPSLAAFNALWSALIGGAMAATLAWATLIGRHSTNAQRANSRDSIERSQSERARAGAFTDVLFVAAGGLLLVSLLRIDASALLALSVLMAVGLLDFSVRYRVLQRRES